jgi:hypothetical protein
MVIKPAIFVGRDDDRHIGDMGVARREIAIQRMAAVASGGFVKGRLRKGALGDHGEKIALSEAIHDRDISRSFDGARFVCGKAARAPRRRRAPVSRVAAPAKPGRSDKSDGYK